MKHEDYTLVRKATQHTATHIQTVPETVRTMWKTGSGCHLTRTTNVPCGRRPINIPASRTGQFQTKKNHVIPQQRQLLLKITTASQGSPNHSNGPTPPKKKPIMILIPPLRTYHTFQHQQRIIQSGQNTDPAQGEPSSVEMADPIPVSGILVIGKWISRIILAIVVWISNQHPHLLR